MRTIAIAIVMLVGIGAASARITRSWNYRELYDTADVVAIVTPTKTRARTEKAQLPNISEMQPNGKPGPVMGLRHETEFEILVLVKGTVDPKTRILLHHYGDPRVGASVNGPMLVSFEPKDKLQYLVFLKKGADGQYVAVSGQTDPWFSVEKLQHRAP